MAMFPSMEQLQYMQNKNIMELDREQLARAEDIQIDTTKSVEKRIQFYVEQTGNPFAQNIGRYLLQVGFQEDTGDSIEDRLLLLAGRKSRILM